ncbi:MAG: lipase family protein, partial [Cyanobacteriota bacterium]
PQTVIQQAVAMPAGPAGTATWTLPLRVSLSFGAPVLEGANGAPEAEAAHPEAMGDATHGRWGLFGSRPPASPAPTSPPVPPTAGPGDFRLAALASGDFDWHASLSLCLASELAYKSAAEVKAQARAWGFSDSAFVEKGAAQGFLAWTASLAMVAFRGTESTADWLSNLHLTTRELPGVGRVHAGFLEQFEALRPALDSLLIGRASLPLLVTGHSLGGAIAVVAASSWASTRPVRALYTYGQPAVAADKGTATTINAALSGRYHRLVNDTDIVPRVPPGYRHGGHLLRFDGRGRVTSKEPPPAGGPGGTRALEGVADAASPFALEEPMLSPEEFRALQGQLRLAVATRGPSGTRGLISDHMLPGYLSRIRQQIP